MAAHVPRRYFAAPFVVTVSVGSVGAAACNGASATPPPQQPETTASASAAPTASASAPATATASASTTPPVDPPIDATTWKVTKLGPDCEADKQVICNTSMPCTPHPKKYACPPEVSRYPANVVRKAGATECTVLVLPDMTCPPGMRCNPPPPHDVTVPCPQ